MVLRAQDKSAEDNQSPQIESLLDVFFYVLWESPDGLPHMGAVKYTIP